MIYRGNLCAKRAAAGFLRLALEVRHQVREQFTKSGILDDWDGYFSCLGSATSRKPLYKHRGWAAGRPPEVMAVPGQGPP